MSLKNVEETNSNTSADKDEDQISVGTENMILFGDALTGNDHRSLELK